MDPVGKALSTAIGGLVILVDYSLISNCSYTRTITEIVPAIGYNLAQLIIAFSLSPSNLELIGHGIGAHIAAYTGAALNGTLGKITGREKLNLLKENK